MRSGARAFFLILVLLGGASSSPVTGAEAAPPATGPAIDGLVSLSPGVDAARVAHALGAAGFTVTERFDFAGVWAIHGPADALPTLPARIPGIVRALEDEPLTPLLDRSRGVVNADGPGGLPLPETGRNVTIAVVDSGVDADHPGFEGRVRAALLFKKNGAVTPGHNDEDGHGTHVAGIALGSGAHSRDARLRGIAPEAGLAALDISDAFTTTSAIRAFRWVHEHHTEHDIRVVTNSWGREKEENHYDPDDPVVRASNALVADGIVVVFSAGNRGVDGRATLTVEAVNPNVIAVGATDFHGRAEPYSSRGPALDEDGESLPWVKPDFAAPGTGIVSTRASAPREGMSGEDAWYVPMNGTSMAAPHVAAAAALLVSRHPGLSPGQVAQVLASTARDVGPDGPDTATGYGLVDVSAALAAVDDAPSPETVTVVKRAPFHAEGVVTGAEGLVLLDGQEPHAPPKDAVRVPLTFPAGTERAIAFFNWSHPAASYRVTLVDPHGRESAPFPMEKPGVIRVDAPARPGTWTLKAQPEGAAVADAWTVNGHALVMETRTLEATGRSDVPDGFGLFGPAGFVEAPPTTILSVFLREVTMTRGVGAVSIAAALALLLAGKRRRT